eukprot:TRINITY_DN66376_c3_g1_i2.p2 TRINITY_DN66376_c3_g1~~TRINITY_DN66376_c3_g1_i2.p2  ORF type:complete len:581 (+),score=268.81 TRINITY_DN66376_c3_g1_i2:132-1745(+)
MAVGAAVAVGVTRWLGLRRQVELRRTVSGSSESGSSSSGGRRSRGRRRQKHRRGRSRGHKRTHSSASTLSTTSSSMSYEEEQQQLHHHQQQQQQQQQRKQKKKRGGKGPQLNIIVEERRKDRLHSTVLTPLSGASRSPRSPAMNGTRSPAANEHNKFGTQFGYSIGDNGNDYEYSEDEEHEFECDSDASNDGQCCCLRCRPDLHTKHRDFVGSRTFYVKSKATDKVKERAAMVDESVKEEIIYQSHESRLHQAIQESLLQMFTHVDSNNDGYVTRAEFVSFLNALGLEAQQRGRGLSDLLLGATKERIDFATFSASVAEVFGNIDQHNHVRVFLGGACGATTWRSKIAIPVFKKHNIDFYNPQVENWNPHLMVLEDLMKACCTPLLFVIDSSTRSLASMIEASQLIAEDREVVLVINNVSVGTNIQGENVSATEAKDLNRARAYLDNTARLHEVPVFDNVEEACNEIVRLARSRTQMRGLTRIRSHNASSRSLLSSTAASPSSSARSSHAGSDEDDSDDGHANGNDDPNRLQTPRNH